MRVGKEIKIKGYEYFVSLCVSVQFLVTSSAWTFLKHASYDMKPDLLKDHFTQEITDIDCIVWMDAERLQL